MTTTTVSRREVVASRRLPFLPARLISAVVSRNVDACKLAVAMATDLYETCTVCTTSDTTVSCWHLRSLWNARDYLKLAESGAPADTPAYPCEPGPAGISCHGRGGHAHIGGHVENGVYKPAMSVLCPRCHGKGWETVADRKRNEAHDRHYVRKMLGF